MKFWKSLVAVCLLLALGACRQEIDQEIVVDPTSNNLDFLENYQPENQPIIASVAGQVVNENKKPAIGAQVILGEQTTQTNEFGYFHFPPSTLNQKGTTVQVKMDGYFPASRTFFPLPNSDQRIKIQLVPMEFTHSFQASTGATILTSEGASIAFPKDAIMDEETEFLYNGEVKVATHWLNPADLATLDQMPGSLHGVTQDLEVGALATYGMLAVELQSPDGKPLNLHAEARATLTMPVPEELQNDAPSNIPLWSYHEELGVWVEEGYATLENGQYTGSVSHFSWWNCDFFLETVYVSFRLLNPDGNPVTEVLAFLTLSSGAVSSANVPDDDGIYFAPVPANEVFTLQLANSCGAIFYEMDLGPFASDDNLGTIIMENIDGETIQASGVVIGCDNQPLSNGYYVSIQHGTNPAVYQYQTDPNFSIYEWACSFSTPSVIRIFDLENNQASSEYSVSPNEFTDLGTIQVCESEVNSHVEITVGGETYLFTDLILSLSPDSTRIETPYLGNPPTNYSHFSAVVGGSGVGDFSGNNRHYSLINHDLNWVFYEYYQNSPQFYDSFIIDQYGDQSGDVISGSFEGSFYNQAAQQLQDISGSFYYIVP